MTAARFESLSAHGDLDFPEYDLPPHEPLGLLQSWLAAAQERGVREPRAMSLATADAGGRASNRIIAISGVDDRGVLFASHRGSKKGREIEQTGWACGVLYWRETAQQVVIGGPVTELGDEDSEAMWRVRPVPLHPMTTVSRQSEPVEDLSALRERARRLEAEGQPLPRPERFCGYLLAPATVEFWCASPDRLHRRLQFERVSGGWRTTRLQP